MIDDAATFVAWWLSAVWDFFAVTMPGLNISVGAFALGSMLVAVAASLLPLVFGFGGSDTESYRSGSSGRARKIAERRRNDEY